MTLKGNLVDFAEQGKFDVIVHGCNCFHTMGAGIAKEIATRYPDAYLIDKQYTDKGDRIKLGGYTNVLVTAPNGNKFTIVNAYTQYYYGRPKKGTGPVVDYTALETAFRTIATNYKHLRIGYPKIGAGLAGGDWLIIEAIINKELTNCIYHELVIINKA